MKYFILTLLVLTLATSAFAARSNPIVDMGLLYAQQSLGFSKECFTDLQKVFELGVEIYESFTAGKNADIIAIIMKGLPLLNDLKAHCL